MNKNVICNCYFNPLNEEALITPEEERGEAITFFERRITDDIFLEKRFDRFVEKTSKNIFDIYIKKTFPRALKQAAYMANENDIKNITNSIEMCIFLWQNYLYPGNTEQQLREHPLTDLLRDSYMSSTINILKYEHLRPIQHTFVLLPFDPTPGALEKSTTTFYDMVTTEMKCACKQYVKRKANSNPDIEDDNYFKLLPTKYEECEMLFTDLLQGVFISLYAMFNSSEAEAMGQYMTNKIKDEQKKEQWQRHIREQELLNKIEDRNNLIDCLNNEIERLEKQLEQQPKTINDEHRAIREHNEALLRKISKLERMLASSTSSKNNESELILNDEIIEDDIMDIDYNKKYIFVGNDNKGFQEQIIKQFPNAVFVDSNINLFAASIDMVIALTNHMSHSTYYDVKEQCKNKGIPFIHCKYSNVELIKELIWNYMN